MNFSFNIKGRVFYSALILMSLTSCISIYKKIIGFKTPEVVTIEKLKENRNKIFNHRYLNDYYYENVEDTVSLNEILSFSFKGGLNIYNKNGNKICFKGSTCITDDLKIINKNIDTLKVDCNEKLDDKIKNLINLDLKSNMVTPIFNNYDYFVIYYWSSFMSKSESINREFEFIEHNLDSSKCKIIRINCDFLEIWGLEKGKKMKLKFEKENDGYYNVNLESIPWKKTPNL